MGKMETSYLKFLWHLQKHGQLELRLTSTKCTHLEVQNRKTLASFRTNADPATMMSNG